jgi:hypothetical protein
MSRDNGGTFDWNGHASNALRAAWDAGHSASVIAHALTARFDFPVTKNMVIGRAHRMDLPKRVSGGASRATRPPRPVVRPVARIMVAPSRGQGHAPRVVSTLAPAVAEPPPVVRAARPVPAHRAGEGCKFPLWGKGKPTHRYCDAARDNGSSYCAAHRRICTTQPMALTEEERNARRERMPAVRAHKRALPGAIGLAIAQPVYEREDAA